MARLCIFAVDQQFISRRFLRCASFQLGATSAVALAPFLARTHARAVLIVVRDASVSSRPAFVAVNQLLGAVVATPVG
jgi:hypothetical protein